MSLEKKRFYYLHDPVAAYNYGRIGNAAGIPIQGKYGVETSGASVTVTATDGTPFDPIKVGDLLYFVSARPEETILTRKCATKTSGASITVDSAITLAAGTAWSFEPFTIGTAATDGWHSTVHYSAITVFGRLETLASTSIDVLPEGPGADGAGSVPLAAATNLTATGGFTININQVVKALRIGVKSNTDSAGDELTLWVVGEMLRAR
jgi:hypothetical protein